MDKSNKNPTEVGEQRRRSIEAGIRGLLALFAATLGFGLKNIVEPKAEALQAYHWLIFIVVAGTFARFIAGSAIHLTYEYARKERFSQTTFVFDFLTVGLFGIIGMLVCYSQLPGHVLLWLGALSAVAFTWAVIRMRFFKGAGIVHNWYYLMAFNVMTGATFGIFYCIQRIYGNSYSELYAGLQGWTWFWIAAAGVSIVFFILDICMQLGSLHLDDA